ncbi:MAG: hypothetical protein KF847_04940 [Pirellulales bacterium]|nr:hypothetical protein [Pirellulales bacterium]
MVLFAQFLLRLAFGLAACMATVSPRLVSSGYFRNHLYVTLGLAAMAALATGAIGSGGMAAAAVAAGASYVGAVCWLYEKPAAGKIALLAVAFAALASLWQLSEATAGSAALPAVAVLRRINLATSGLLVGAVTAAMLLGHWYLNAPGMKLEPLRRLIALIVLAIVLQVAVCSVGAGLSWKSGATFDGGTLALLAIRWGFGLLGVAALAWMARKTLEIPNTQSATGILYVAVIGAFTGEVMSILLAAEHAYPM